MEHLIVLRAAFVDLIADIGDIDSTCAVGIRSTELLARVGVEVISAAGVLSPGLAHRADDPT